MSTTQTLLTTEFAPTNQYPTPSFPVIGLPKTRFNNPAVILGEESKGFGGCDDG
jgi:hypothetical protein